MIRSCLESNKNNVRILSNLGQKPSFITDAMQTFCLFYITNMATRTLSLSLPDGSVVKNLLANAGDAGGTGLIPGQGRSPGIGNGNPLQYSCLENFMDRRAQRATTHEVAKSQT